MTEQEVLQKLLDTNSNLVAMMTGDENSTVTIDGVEHPTFKKFIKDTLLIDLNAIKDETEALRDEVQTLKDETEALRDEVQTFKNETVTNIVTIQNLKSDIEDIKAEIDNALFDMRQNAGIVRDYKKSINDYVGQLEIRLRELNKSCSELECIQEKVYSSQLVITQLAGEVKADKLTVVEYLTARPNQSVNEYSYNNNQLVKSPCANFSALHYLEKIMLQASFISSSCKEFIPLSLEDNTPSTVCILGGATGGEVIELELEDGSTENIEIRGNP